MPTLKDQLRADLTAAMKARDDTRTRTLRMALTAISTEEVAGSAAHDLTDEQWADHVNGMVPEALGIMNARLSGYPSGIPTTYVNMSRDVPVPPHVADQMVANLGPGVLRRTIDAGHSVMVSQPAALATIIDEALAR